MLMITSELIDLLAMHTITGDWTFTSPTRYLAFVSAVSQDYCDDDDKSIITDGVITLSEPEELQTNFATTTYMASSWVLLRKF